jgi:hypothetical protein
MSVTRDNPPGHEERAKQAPMWQGGRRRGERAMVPRATFSSYYGRPVLKKPVWEERDIAGYLFTGGVAAGSALLAAGADRRHLPALRRVTRVSSLAALGISGVALVHDLGRRDRFFNMLRVFKPTSPMSVGSWLLSAFAVPVSVAVADEFPALVPPPLRGVVRAMAPVAGVSGAVLGSGVATYTAVLLADTSAPSWHAAYPELPFVFAGSALAGSSGIALALVPPVQAGPARRLAALGSALELAASQRMENRLGLVGEPYHEGGAGRKLRAAKALTVAGVATATLFGRRSRVASVLAGVSLAAASALTRFGVFEAGVASTEDPVYTVAPQRARLEQRGS